MAGPSCASPGTLTALSADQARTVRRLGLDAVGLCAAVQGLIALPGDAFGAGLPPDRMAERNTRSAERLLDRVVELDGAPFDRARSADRRIVGTCRHFAVLSVAFLQAAGVPSRARCGFASYFVPAKLVDHWIAEHWSEPAQRWVRIDAEILGTDLVDRPDDLAAGEFLTGGEVWRLVRTGAIDPMDVGVHGTEHWGPAEIRGNVIRDLAARNQIEVLPWDSWGPMDDSYEGRTGEDFDRLIDEVAAACAGEDESSLRSLYRRLAVPSELIR